MPSRSPARLVAALLTGLVFVTANAAPVVCAAVHHSQRAADHGAAHHQHTALPAPGATGATVGSAPVAAPPCTDMSHCGVAVNGVTATVTALQVAADHPAPLPAAPAASPFGAAFSPPTPPPRA